MRARARSRLENGWVYRRPAGVLLTRVKKKNRQTTTTKTREIYTRLISHRIFLALKTGNFSRLSTAGSSSRRAPREAAGCMRGALTEAGLRLMRAVPPSLLQTAPALRISVQ